MAGSKWRVRLIIHKWQFDIILFGYLQIAPIQNGRLGLYLNMAPIQDGRFKMKG
jgi:hypothetical protein